MGIIKRAADLAYTFRFIRMMAMDWKSWDAYKLGIIDENGKRQRNVKLDNDEKKSAYTPFIRLAANLKRLVSAVPGGGSKLGSFASALFLIKEKVGEKGIKSICEEMNVEVLDFLNEKNEWFLLDEKQLSPGIYRVQNPKLLNGSCAEMVWPKDQVRVQEECYPVGDVFGVDIYEATHVNTDKQVYVTASELIR
jgi:hypothetical protein|tara:strand:+ start:2163 stop:2744 length:582 start_codon:yes stop_codon:yes gene_type:complete